ncbi:Predicted arabinose efflux permease, MFS family [Geodermatophilus saharensis]|uniref:Predicted arabinose efflux permease, MFS family n=1 Tax=Geodermatophilus saharensis TaxID=1137994 RepID=A0A239IUL1_9ACTN|nr:MFS transporter [Geodermatophilus saharensis]SNS96918.1 Predicted arabinose efflux permease, MFS family [Geodermatophilus saharensis]
MSGNGAAGTAEGRPSFRAVFAVREFRPLFGTYTLSTIGDELARVALTVLVYQRTDSPLLSAFTFALSFLPWALGGPVLATIADRFPRQRVLVVSDVLRAGLVAAMAVPGTPLPVLLALLFAVSLCAPPFESARSALMADVLEGERYAVATSLTNVSLQVAQVVGFVAAGALVTAFDPSVVLLLNAATFVVSALWLSVGLQRRPAPIEPTDEPSSVWRETGEGLRLIGRSPRLVAIIGLLWTGTLFANAAEGIAAPLTDDLGEGAVALGVLLAANPLGVTVGGLVVARLLGTTRAERLMPVLVVLSLAPVLLAGLVALAAGPGRGAYGLVVALLFVAGLGASWTIPLNVAFVQAVPPAVRGRAFGVAVSGLYGVQGLGALGAGLAAERVPAAAVVAIAGGLGLVAVVPPLLALARTRPAVAGRHRTAGPSVS